MNSHNTNLNSTLQNNIKALATGVNEPLAAKIIHFLNTQNFTRFELSENGNIFDRQNQVFMYSSTQSTPNHAPNPQAMHSELELYASSILAATPRYPFICIYGIANGLLAQHLAPHYQHILVFESELELLILALSLVDMSKELFSGRIYLLDAREERFQNQLLMLFDSKDIFEWLELYELFIGAEFYKNYYQKELIETDNFCIDCQHIIIRNAGSNLKLPLNCLKNLIHNVPTMLQSIPYQRLLSERKNAFEVAIIVSAGPSLSKQLPLLNKMQDKAVIFAADGALKSLEAAGIEPDYVLNIDFANHALKFFDLEDSKTAAQSAKSTTNSMQDNSQNPALTSKNAPQFSNYPVNPSENSATNSKNCPPKKSKFLAFLSILTHPDLVKRLDNKCVVLNEDAFCRRFHLNDFGYIETGTMVSHCAYTLALELGFKTIIAIGQDLAFDESGNSHAKGFAFGEKMSIAGVQVEHTHPKLKVPAYGGTGEVTTHIAWNDYRIKLEYLFARFLDKATFINATQGGARIAFMREMSFESACEQFLTRTKPKFAPIKPLTASRSEKLLHKFIARLKEDEREALGLLDSGAALKNALQSILEANKDLPLAFLQNVAQSIEKFNAELNASTYLNNSISKVLFFERGRLLASLYKQKISDEKIFLLHFLNIYKDYLEFFMEQINLRLDILREFLSSQQ